MKGFLAYDTVRVTCKWKLSQTGYEVTMLAKQMQDHLAGPSLAYLI